MGAPAGKRRVSRERTEKLEAALGRMIAAMDMLSGMDPVPGVLLTPEQKMTWVRGVARKESGAAQDALAFTPEDSAQEE